LGPADFPLSGPPLPQAPAEPHAEPSRLDAVEKAAIIRALEKHDKNISRTADALGLTRTSLYRRMEKYGL
jgi:transcriptional regulator of acetoin/glycerol metabolism